ncbi:MAG: circularly permuted type 2 ATP-grasp protein, partial [Dokdonella sp.]|uniref:circularly permuted type 2 ATP-grasp protein n=1 Tax=Dokdonella sp. TaxID=2291710 RepID=UPI003264A1CC
MPPMFDEMHHAGGELRAHYHAFDHWLQSTPEQQVEHKRREAEISFHRVGITFSVYGEESGNERLIPFDLVPRIVPSAEWRMLEAGLRQRVLALNLFLADVYGEQRILAEGRVPRELVLGNSEYRTEMHGLKVPGGVYSHISGIDLVRAGDGEYYVLEDNLRVPSGVSYMLENRRMMARLIP